MPLEGVDALCACGDCLFCACGRERAIWRADRASLMPQAVCPGGPGMCAMCASDDGARLYTFLGEADSVLMSDAKTGGALFVGRCGCNPGGMTMHDSMLIIAGGEDGCVHGLDAATLESRFCLSMPGPVWDAAAARGRIHALCLTQELSSLLITVEGGEQRCVLALEGMPGCLHMQDNRLLAATQGWIYAVSADGRRIIARERAPGRAIRMEKAGNRLLLLDPLSERLYARGGGGDWRIVHEHVRALAAVHRITHTESSACASL